MIYEVTATVNTDNGEFEYHAAANSLDTIWAMILHDHPTVSSVVFVFCKPKEK